MYVTGFFSFVFSILGDETKRKLYVGQSHFPLFIRKKNINFMTLKKGEKESENIIVCGASFGGPVFINLL